ERTLKILMLDDEPEHTLFHCEALEDEGYSVVCRSTVDDALAILKVQNNFNLIIMDLLMPPSQADRLNSVIDLRQTGVILFNKIRNELGLSDIPIIIMSVVRDPEVIRKIKEINQQHNGKLEIFRKPLRPKILINQVRIM